MSRDVNEPILDVSRDVIEPILDERVTYIYGTVSEKIALRYIYKMLKTLLAFESL